MMGRIYVLPTLNTDYASQPTKISVTSNKLAHVCITIHLYMVCIYINKCILLYLHLSLNIKSLAKVKGIGKVKTSRLYLDKSTMTNTVCCDEIHAAH